MMRPLWTSKSTSLTATRPPNVLRACCTLQQRRSRRGQRASGRLPVIARLWWRRRRRRPEQDRPQAGRRGLQDQHQHGAECDGFVIAGIADQPGQEILQFVAQEGDAGRAQDRAVNAAGAAKHRHQQIFGAGADAERAGRYRALEMRVKPSGQPREHRGIDEHHQFCGGGIDAKGFTGAGAAAKRADRAADPAAEQVLRRDDRKHHRDPDHDEIIARCGQRIVADPQWRNAGEAIMGAEPVEIAEQIKKRDAPGDGAERQIMTG